MVTIDLNNLLYIILIAVAIILLIFLIVAVARLIQTLKRLNGILEDVSTVSGIVSEKAIQRPLQALQALLPEMNQELLRFRALQNQSAL